MSKTFKTKRAKSVDDILGSFRKTVAQLEQCEAAHASNAATCAAAAREMSAISEGETVEAERAARVKEKLLDLIGG